MSWCFIETGPVATVAAECERKLEEISKQPAFNDLDATDKANAQHFQKVIGQVFALLPPDEEVRLTVGSATYFADLNTKTDVYHRIGFEIESRACARMTLREWLEKEGRL
jgi:hypothetical protein